MSVLYPPDSAYAKEMVKHEAQYSPFGPPQRPYLYREYPMMLHKAGRPANGMGPDEIIETCIVESEQQRANKSHEGFRATPLEALEAFQQQQFEYAELAAERNFHERRMSPAAQAEASAANAAGSFHVPSVPVTPIKRRGRKPNPVTPPTAAQE